MNEKTFYDIVNTASYIKGKSMVDLADLLNMNTARLIKLLKDGYLRDSQRDRIERFLNIPFYEMIHVFQMFIQRDTTAYKEFNSMVHIKRNGEFRDL